MMRLLRDRTFVTLVAMLIACGYAHQLEGNTERHHHCDDATAHDESHRSDSSDAGEDGCDRAVCHHGVTAVVVLMDNRACYAAHLLGILTFMAKLPSDVDPAEIDYPPRLA